MPSHPTVKIATELEVLELSRFLNSDPNIFALASITTIRKSSPDFSMTPPEDGDWLSDAAPAIHIWVTHFRATEGARLSTLYTRIRNRLEGRPGAEPRRLDQSWRIGDDTKIVPYLEKISSFPFGRDTYRYYQFEFYGFQPTRSGSESVNILDPRMIMEDPETRVVYEQHESGASGITVELAGPADVQNLLNFLSEDASITERASLEHDLFTAMPDFTTATSPRPLMSVPTVTLVRRQDSESRNLKTIYDAVSERLREREETTTTRIADGHFVRQSEDECDVLIPHIEKISENTYRYYLLRFTAFSYYGTQRTNIQAIDPRVVLNDPSVVVTNPWATEGEPSGAHTGPATEPPVIRLPTEEDCDEFARQLSEVRLPPDRIKLKQMYEIVRTRAALPLQSSIVGLEEEYKNYILVTPRPRDRSLTVKWTVQEAIIPALPFIEDVVSHADLDSMYRLELSHDFSRYFLPVLCKAQSGDLVLFLIWLEGEDYTDNDGVYGSASRNAILKFYQQTFAMLRDSTEPARAWSRTATDRESMSLSNSILDVSPTATDVYSLCVYPWGEFGPATGEQYPLVIRCATGFNFLSVVLNWRSLLHHVPGVKGIGEIYRHRVMQGLDVYFLPVVRDVDGERVLHLIAFYRNDYLDSETEYGTDDPNFAFRNFIPVSTTATPSPRAELPTAQMPTTPRLATAGECAMLANELRNSTEARGSGDQPLGQFFAIHQHNVSLEVPRAGTVFCPVVDMRPTYLANLMGLLTGEVIPTLASLDGSYDVPSPSSMYRYNDERGHRQYLFPFTRDLPTGELVTFLLHFHASDYEDYHLHGDANPEWLSLLVRAEAPTADPLDPELPPDPIHTASRGRSEGLIQSIKSFDYGNPYTGLSGPLSETFDVYMLPATEVPNLPGGRYNPIRIAPRTIGNWSIATLVEKLIPLLRLTPDVLGTGDMPIFKWEDIRGSRYVLPVLTQGLNERLLHLLMFSVGDFPDSTRGIQTTTDIREAFELVTGTNFFGIGPDEVRCRRCGGTVPLSTSNAVLIGPTQTTAWCQPCVNTAATRCPSCGGLAQTFRMVQAGDRQVCPPCGQRYLQQQRSTPPARTPTRQPTPPSGPSIREYHQTDRNWVLRGDPSNGVYYGVELEVIHQSGQTDKYKPAADALVPLKNIRLERERAAKEWIIVEFDGSLRNNDTDRYYGFEIVFHPVTPEFAYEHEELFGNVLDTLVKNGMISYQSVNFKKPNGDVIDCGIHISVTRKAIPVLSQVKMQKLFYENPDFIWRVSRRREESLKDWARVTPPETDTGERPTYAQIAKGKVRTIKYMALNFKTEVIEIRIFRGPLKAESLMMDLEFAQAVVEFCTDMRYGLTDMTLPQFLTYVCERERDFAYLGSWLREKGLLDGYC
jgi:hypothetical protein